MPSQLQTLLLVGGLALVGIGVIVAIVAMTLVVVRRQRREAESPRLGAAFEGLGTGASDPGRSTGAGSTGSGSTGSGSTGAGPGGSGPGGSGIGAYAGLEHLFVATPDAVQAAPQDSQPIARLETIRPSSPAPSSSAAPTAWGDIIAAETPHPEDAGYTTSSFAPPGRLLHETPTVAPRGEAAPQPIVAPAPPAELTSPPLANPWIGTGPQRPVEAAAASSEPAASSEISAPAEVSAPSLLPGANTTETVPTIVVEHLPLAEPAAPPAAGEREAGPEPFVPGPEPGDDEDRTVILGGPSRASWLLILDGGERIAIPAESVVLGRRPAPIEHGVPGVLVPDATKTISKVHARIDRSGEHWTLTDLGSTNGCSIIEAAGRERLLPSGGSEVIRGRFLLGEVGMILVRNPEGPQ